MLLALRNAIQLEHCMTTSYILQVTRELVYSGWRKHLCQNLFFNEVAGACNFIKKETLAQVSSSEFCEISKNTFSYRTPPLATSSIWRLIIRLTQSNFATGCWTFALNFGTEILSKFQARVLWIPTCLVQFRINNLMLNHFFKSNMWKK